MMPQRVILFNIILLVSLVFFLVPPLGARAQFDGNDAPFTLSISSNPQPYSTVVVTPISGSMSTTNGTIVVKASGQTVYSGNARAFSVPLGAPGVPVTIAVTLTVAGVPDTETVTITPQDVSLVAEPISSVPLLYLGKPLPAIGGEVRLVAMADLRTPSGKRLNPSTLSYTWSIDDAEDMDDSGIGKQAIVIDSPLLYRSHTVSVVVTSPDGTLSGSAMFDVIASDPVVRIYQHDPLLGVLFDKALSDTFSINGPEITFYAGTYSFPSDNGAPQIEWYVNGSDLQNGPTITLRPTGQGTGSASVSATAGTGDAAGSSALSVSFGSAGGGNLLGL